MDAPKTTRSKFFRAFTEGQTVSDGRTITAEMIDQIVENHNPATYTPGINVEHISGFSPNPPFNRYGDVFAVEGRDVEVTIGGKNEKRRALYCQIDAYDQLVQLAASGQKPFPSVELTPDYSGTKKIGLVGLAFTDNPASIATEKLKFSRSVPGSDWSKGTEAVALEFEAKPQDEVGLAATIGAAFGAALAKFGSKPAEAVTPPAPVTPPATPPASPANDNAAMFAAMGEAVSKSIAAAVAPINAQFQQLSGDLTTLKTKLEAAEAPGFSRPPATGGSVDAKYATDC